MITVGEASDELSVSPDTIRRWHKKGMIKAVRDSYNRRLFSIEEIARIHGKMSGRHSQNNYRVLKTSKKSSYNCIELFAGAGGTALGMENAGIKHELLVEYDKDCVATLKANRPDWNIIADDVRNVDFKGIKADIVQGGFPCQAFSYAGHSRGFEDTRGTLFFEFARCVQEIQPKIALAENVRGLERHDEGRTLTTMLKAMEGLGYRITYKIMRSQYLDVPQKRERLIILAVRQDLDVPFAFPKEKDYTISLREAIGDKPKADGQKYTEKKLRIMKMVPPGGYWRDLPENVQAEYMGASRSMDGGKTGMARRLSWDEPSLTLTCNPAQKQTERCHPDETRPLNIREYARIQTFPDSWEFIGSRASQYRQIGNAVPVNLGYHLGACLISMLNGQIDEDQTNIIDHTSISKATQMTLI